MVWYGMMVWYCMVWYGMVLFVWSTWTGCQNRWTNGPRTVILASTALGAKFQTISRGLCRLHTSSLPLITANKDINCLPPFSEVSTVAVTLKIHLVGYTILFFDNSHEELIENLLAEKIL